MPFLQIKAKYEFDTCRVIINPAHVVCLHQCPVTPEHSYLYLSVPVSDPTADDFGATRKISIVEPSFEELKALLGGER